MEFYLLKSGACIAIFYAFYLLFLEKESVHNFKRFYLLGTVFASFLIPLITFTQYVEVAPMVASVFISEGISTAIPVYTEQSINYTPYIIWGIYGLGVLLFAYKFGKNLHSLFQKIKKNPKYKDKSVYHVLLQSRITPHTFFNFIFLNKDNYESKKIPEAVLLHETAHAEQRHSIDILCIELLHIIFWFNPLIYFIKRSIKLNHEFLADRAVLQEGVDTSTYQKLLLAFSSSAASPTMANSINYSLIKKRFTVMKTNTSPRKAWLRTVVILPIIAVMIYGFSNSKTIEVTSEAKTEDATTSTLVSVSDYNTMARFWNDYFNENPGKREIPLTELRKLETLYKALTPLERATAEPFPECSAIEANATKSDYATTYLNGAKRNHVKAFVLMVTVNEISLNGKPSTLKTIANDMDAITESWEEPDYTDAKPSILITSSSQEFLELLDSEFRKTHYSKANEGIGLVYEKTKISSTFKATPEEVAEYNLLAKKYNNMPRNNMRIKGKELTRMQYIYELMTQEQKKSAEPYPDLPPPPPAPNAPKSIKVIKGVNDGDLNIPPPPPPPPATKVIKGVNDADLNVPPPPPTPESPLDHIIYMAKKGATFYYEGKKVSSDEAIKRIKKNKSLNIQTTRTNTNNPQVKISKEPYTYKKTALNNDAPKVQNQTNPVSLNTGNVTINGKEYFYASKNGETTYYDRFGEQVDKQGNPITITSLKKTSFFYNGEKISTDKANNLLRTNSNIQVTNRSSNSDEYTVVLTNLKDTSTNTNRNKNENPNSTQGASLNMANLISQGANFYYDGKQLNANEARQLLKTTKNLNVHTTQTNNEPPMVQISKKPEDVVGMEIDMQVMNLPKAGPTPDLTNPSKLLEYLIENSASLYLSKQKISPETARTLVKKNTLTIRMIGDTPDGKAMVLFGNGC